MANPEEAYQISRWIVDLMRGRVRVMTGEVTELHPEDVNMTDEGAIFEVEGATGTFEIVVRERNR